MKQWLAIAATFTLGLVLIARSAPDREPEPTGLVADVQQLRQHDRNTTVDISSIVAGHLPVGMTRDDTETLLKAQGFTLHHVLDKAGAHELVASHARPSVWNLGMHDEIRVIATFSEARVSQTRGWLFFKGV